MAPTRQKSVSRLIARIVLRVLALSAAIVLTVILVRAFDSRRLAALQPWHDVELEQEYRASSGSSIESLDDYLALEERLFAELDQDIHDAVAPQSAGILNRYDRTSSSFPGRFTRNWNRTYELSPDSRRGGVLLLHGLSDSPYSLRAVAEVFRTQGFYVLVLRMPGHGTTPAGLARARWQDWVDSVRVGARHVREQAGDGGQMIVGGYSNGGVLALKYALDALEGEPDAVPDRIYLFSPAIGVSSFAVVAGWHKLLSWIPYFERFAWMSVRPEYDPFKYNSFPKNAGRQIYLLTTRLHQQIDHLRERGTLDRLPPMLAFQSLVDSTVKTDAIVQHLFAKLIAADSELVLFDVNREAGIQEFMKAEHSALHDRLTGDPTLPFTVTLITNRDTDALEVEEMTRPPGQPLSPGRPLDLAWPRQIYSLSHVAIPFSPEDPLYGDGSGRPDLRGPWLGRVQPRGERNVLIVPLNQLMRLRYNPFFAYIEARIVGSLATASSQE